jgi:hypothetical protein
MMRAKLLAVLAGMIATLAVSAVPASAEFASNSTATKGAGKSGPVVLEGGGATLECTSGEGTWTILSGGKAATKGTDLQLDITTWAGCKAKTSLVKGVTAEVKACTLELEQAAGVTKAKGSTVTECTVVVKVLGTCTIAVPAGQKGLEKNLLENSGENLIVNAEDAGITSEPKGGGCIGISKTTNAKEKAKVTGTGLKEV